MRRLRALEVRLSRGAAATEPATGASHAFAVRVYYEDTDHSGLVYHANYLKFIERARSEWVRGRGIDQAALARDGHVFAVARLEADFHAPARYDDLLRVETAPAARGGAPLLLRQEVWRAEMRLFSATVTLVCLGSTGRPVRLPPGLAGDLDL